MLVFWRRFLGLFVRWTAFRQLLFCFLWWLYLLVAQLSHVFAESRGVQAFAFQQMRGNCGCSPFSCKYLTPSQTCDFAKVKSICQWSQSKDMRMSAKSIDPQHEPAWKHKQHPTPSADRVSSSASEHPTLLLCPGPICWRQPKRRGTPPKKNRRITDSLGETWVDWISSPEPASQPANLSKGLWGPHWYKSPPEASSKTM